MANHSSLGTAQALYRVFVAPLACGRLAQPPRTRHNTPVPRGSMTQQMREYYKPVHKPEVRREQWNEDITAQTIALVNPETGKLQPPVDKLGVLMRMNTTTHRLVLVRGGRESPDLIPVCKIVDIKAHNNAKKAREEAMKPVVKAKALEASLKTIELNWAIDPNDLGHRLSKLKAFLQEGRKVEIVLAAKKRGRVASREECHDVISKIQSTVRDINGATETKTMQGKLGGVAMLSYQGKANSTTAKTEESS